MSIELKRVKRTADIVELTKTCANNGVVNLFHLSSISKNGKYYLIRVKVIIKFINLIFFGFMMLIIYIGTIDTIQNQCAAKINL